jgi:hypothetical protein
MSGKGLYKYVDGNEYEGEFERDQRNGQGILRYANGDVYDGNWKDGKKNGTGKLSCANGDDYVGGELRLSNFESCIESIKIVVQSGSMISEEVPAKLATQMGPLMKEACSRYIMHNHTLCLFTTVC